MGLLAVAAERVRSRHFLSDREKLKTPIGQNLTGSLSPSEVVRPTINSEMSRVFPYVSLHYYSDDLHQEHVKTAMKELLKDNRVLDINMGSHDDILEDYTDFITTVYNAGKTDTNWVFSAITYRITGKTVRDSDWKQLSDDAVKGVTGTIKAMKRDNEDTTCSINTTCRLLPDPDHIPNSTALMIVGVRHHCAKAPELLPPPPPVEAVAPPQAPRRRNKHKNRNRNRRLARQAEPSVAVAVAVAVDSSSHLVSSDREEDDDPCEDPC